MTSQTILKWSARAISTGSGQKGPVSSSAPVGQSAGIWRVVAGKMYALALDPVRFGRSEWTNGKRPQFLAKQTKAPGP